MNKKSKTLILIALIAAIVLGVGAYAATHMVALDKTGMVNPEATKEALETAETVEHTETAEITETEDDAVEVEILELGGQITEIGDGYILIMDNVHGAVQVNLGDDTLYDGADLEELSVGQYIQVMYDGKMTRSLPAQVYALKIGLYPIYGVVTEVGEGSITLSREEIGDVVVVFLPQGAAIPAVGDSVTAYTIGMMTMSIPAKTHAIGVVVN